MRCACATLTILTGNEADLYANEHLQKVEVDAVNWTKRFKCPDTGESWLMDYPESHLQGGGSPRLRRLNEVDQPIDERSVDQLP